MPFRQTGVVQAFFELNTEARVCKLRSLSPAAKPEKIF